MHELFTAIGCKASNVNCFMASARSLRVSYTTKEFLTSFLTSSLEERAERAVTRESGQQFVINSCNQQLQNESTNCCKLDVANGLVDKPVDELVDKLVDANLTVGERPAKSAEILIIRTGSYPASSMLQVCPDSEFAINFSSCHSLEELMVN